MKEIQKTFDRKNLPENDTAVTDFVNDTYDMQTDTYDIDFLSNQISKVMNKFCWKALDSLRLLALKEGWFGSDVKMLRRNEFRSDAEAEQGVILALQGVSKGGPGRRSTRSLSIVDQSETLK